MTATRAKSLAQLRLRDINKLNAKLRVAVDAYEAASARAMEKFVTTRTSEKGQPYSQEFEEHARRLLSTGISAGQCRQHVKMNSSFMLHGKALEGFVVPSFGWFAKMRGSVGLHSWVYAMVAIAGAEAVLQYGYDETQIDKVSTFNQWCLIYDKQKELNLITFEAGGMLVGGTAEKIASHIETSWARGAEAVMVLRNELIREGGIGLADLVAPLRQGGLNY